MSPPPGSADATPLLTYIRFKLTTPGGSPLVPRISDTTRLS